MRAGTVAGLVVAGLVLLVCGINLVLAALGGGSVWELLFWGFGVLLGGYGLLVFLQRRRLER